jgi:hypothetical protein
MLYLQELTGRNHDGRGYGYGGTSKYTLALVSVSGIQRYYYAGQTYPYESDMHNYQGSRDLRTRVIERVLLMKELKVMLP